MSRRKWVWVRVVFRVGNCENVSEPKPWEEGLLALTKPGHYGLPDVVFLSEVSWLRVEPFAKRLGFDAVQFGERGDPEAGVAIASRFPISDAELEVMTRPVPGEVRMRPIVTGTILGEPVAAGHAPPPRTPIQRMRYLARLRRRGGAVGLDSNQRPAWMRRSFIRKYRGIGVLGLLAPRSWKLSKAKRVDIDSDHWAVDVEALVRVRRNVDTQRVERKDAA